MTTTEHAGTIRKALKSRGWTSRDVSVKATYFSMGSSIDIHIKTPSVPLAAVKAIAEGHEHIRRDERTFDILGGGNRYLHVSYTREALAVLALRYQDAVQRAYDATPEDDSRLTPVEGTHFMIGRRYGRISLWTPSSHMCECSGPTDTAEAIAISLQNEGQAIG